MQKIHRMLREIKRQDGQLTVQGLVRGLEEEIKKLVEESINEGLEMEVEAILGREHHARREVNNRREIQGECRRCGTRQQQKFMRNGHRKRQVATCWGVMRIWVPRVKCECGGSVRLPLELLQPYQRFWGDVDEQIQQWGEWGLTLRQMQEELSDRLGSSVGLRRLNEGLQAIKRGMKVKFRSIPPIILFDAIWVTVMVPTGEYRLDKLGRKRAVKTRRKLAVLVALGVWGENGKGEVLDWEIAEQESQADWEPLLLRLEERGVYRERGVELLVHDGGAGLIAALNFIYPHIPHQRCVFHKLRNIWNVIIVPEGLDKAQRLALKTDLIRQASAVYRAETEPDARSLVAAFRELWAAEQPLAVATLERDLNDTLAFFSVLRRFPHWRPQSLRTTSLLERLNRRIRHMFRSNVLYHSLSGLETALVRVLSPSLAF